MISTRFTLPVIVCFSLALVPTIIHSYIGIQKETENISMSIPRQLGDFTSTPTDRKSQWVQKRFNTDDFIERDYSNPEGNHRVRLFAASSYDHKQLYHHPELALSYGQQLGPAQKVTLPGTPPIPAFVLKYKDRPGLQFVPCIVNTVSGTGPYDVSLGAETPIWTRPGERIALVYLDSKTFRTFASGETI